MSPKGEREGPPGNVGRGAALVEAEGVRSTADVWQGQERTVCGFRGQVQLPPTGTWALGPELPFSRSGCRASHCRALPLLWQITRHLSTVSGSSGRATHSTRWREHACQPLTKEPSRAVRARLRSPLPAARSSEDGKKCLPEAPACYFWPGKSLVHLLTVSEVLTPCPWATFLLSSLLSPPLKSPCLGSWRSPLCTSGPTTLSCGTGRPPCCSLEATPGWPGKPSPGVVRNRSALHFPELFGGDFLFLLNLTIHHNSCHI